MHRRTALKTLGGAVSVMAMTCSWRFSYALGTQGNWYVDPVNGNDQNPGTDTAPFKTFAAAKTASAPGQTILLKDGVYREIIVPLAGVDPTNRTIIQAYGDHKPVVSGADVLTGMSPCKATDADRVGSNWSAMFKFTGLPKTAIASETPRALNLHENGTPLTLCLDWAGGAQNDKFFQQDTQHWHTASSTHVNADNAIIGYSLDKVSSQYTQDQIEAALILGHTVPNFNFWTPVSGFDTTTGIISITKPHRYEKNVYKDRFALLNILPAMTRGGWGWWDNDDGTVDVYVWPNDAASIANGIEFSARKHCVNISGLSFVTLDGLHCRQSAGMAVSRDGAAIVSYDTTVKKQHVTIQRCHVSGIYSERQTGLWVSNTDHLEILDNRLENLQNSYGLFVQGYTPRDVENSQPCTWVNVQNNTARRTEDSPFRFYGCSDIVIGWNRAQDCGWSTHANKLNLYEQCHQGLVWGNTFVNCGGYLTWQEASGLIIGFNYIPANFKDGSGSARAIEDQNSVTPPPNSYNKSTLASYVINNTLPVAPNAVGKASNGLSPSSASVAGAYVVWHVWNNAFHGFYLRAPTQVLSWLKNANAGPDGFYDTSDIVMTPRQMWTDPAKGIFTVPKNSPLRGISGRPLDGFEANILIPLFGDRVPAFNIDCLGNKFDMASPPIGAVAGYDYAPLTA